MHPSCPCFIDCSPSYWLDNLLIGWICRIDGTRPLQGRPSLQHHAGLAEAQAGESHQSRRVERTDGTQHYRSRGFLRRQHAQHHSHRHDQRGMLIINGNSATAVRTTCGGWVQRIRSSRNLRKIRQPFRDWTLCLRDGQSEGKDLLHPTHDWVIRMTTTSLFLFRERERERESSQDHEDGRENLAGEILITDRRVPLLFHETFSPFSLFYYRCARKRARKKNRIWCDWDHLHRGKTDHARKREEGRYRKRKESETLTVCLRGFYKVRWLSYSNGYSLWGAESDQKIRFICMRGLESGELGNKRRYLMLDIFPFSFLSLGLYAVWLRDWCDAHQEMPYVMVRSERNLTGNDRYEGFCIDLLKAIAGIMIVPIYYL